MSLRKTTRRTAAPTTPRTNALQITVSTPLGRYGTPRPQAAFLFPAGGGTGKAWPERMAMAVMHLAAARAEAHTDSAERWSLSVESGMNLVSHGGELRATISMELMEGDPDETARAAKLLEDMAEAFRGATYDGLVRDNDLNPLF